MDSTNNADSNTNMVTDKNTNINVNAAANSKNKWIILVVVLMATFMSALDGSIVNVALPVMAKALNVTSAGIQLVVTSYLIAIVAFILIWGRLGDMLGKTKMFNLGIALFTLGSLLCGMTNSLPILILARVIQAIGAAGTMANNQGIITEVFPVNERGRALGMVGTAVALGSLVGPPLGGFMVAYTSWEYIFLINVPIGIITLFFAVKMLPKSRKSENVKLDVPGSLLFMLFIIPLFGAISKGQEMGFTHPVILAGLLVSVCAFIIFIIVENRQKSPLLHLEIFRDKLFSLSIFCGFLSFVAMFCSNIIQPFYLQDVLNYSPSATGLIIVFSPLVLAVVAPISGHISDKIGSEVLTFIGLSVLSLSLVLMATLNEYSSVISIVSFIVLMSMGSGLFQSPNNSLVMSTVPRNKLGIAGSVNGLVRNLGMITGIALSTTLLYNRMSYKIGYKVTDYVPGRNDAFIYGMRTVYITAAVICLIGAVLTALRLYNRKKPVAVSAVGEK